jgi:hypothetical protein
LAPANLTLGEDLAKIKHCHVLQVVADPCSNHLALGTHLWRICYATHGIAIKVQVKESFTWICCESFFECSYGR